MSKKQRDIALFLVDILVAIQKSKIYIKNFDDKEEFRQDSLHWDATIRQLEIIGEALNKLLEDENFKKSSPDYFRKVVNFRNIIVHGYFGIDVDEVWDVLTKKLDMLQDDLVKIADTSIDLSSALVSTINEYQKLNDDRIVNFLKSMVRNENK